MALGSALAAVPRSPAVIFSGIWGLGWITVTHQTPLQRGGSHGAGASLPIELTARYLSAVSCVAASPRNAVRKRIPAAASTSVPARSVCPVPADEPKHHARLALRNASCVWAGGLVRRACWLSAKTVLQRPAVADALTARPAAAAVTFRRAGGWIGVRALFYTVPPLPLKAPFLFWCYE